MAQTAATAADPAKAGMAADGFQNTLSIQGQRILQALARKPIDQ